jgi:hypothetical protein
MDSSDGVVDGMVYLTHEVIAHGDYDGQRARRR